MNVSPTLFAEKLRHVSPFWYKVGAQASIDKKYPRHLFIETTAACNLTCQYCPRERRGNQMDFGLFRQIVDEATPYGRRSFSLHLFGEPLLYGKIFESIRYLKERRHTVLLTTNGTKLNDCVDEVIYSGIDKVIWTWRPEAKFTSETKEKLRHWGKFMVRLIDEITPPEAYEEWGDWKPQERKNLHNYGGNVNVTAIAFQNSKLSAQNASSTEKARWPCYHLWFAPAVAWNGDILICCNDPYHKEVIGHFPETSVAMAWRSDQLSDIRASHLRSEFRGICSNCDVWKTYPDIFFGFQQSKPSVSSPISVGWVPA